MALILLFNRFFVCILNTLAGFMTILYTSNKINVQIDEQITVFSLCVKNAGVVNKHKIM